MAPNCGTNKFINQSSNRYVKELFCALKLSPFKNYEIKYLHEFVECMKDIADSLYHLQGDQNC